MQAALNNTNVEKFWKSVDVYIAMLHFLTHVCTWMDGKNGQNQHFSGKNLFHSTIHNHTTYILNFSDHVIFMHNMKQNTDIYIIF